LPLCRVIVAGESARVFSLGHVAELYGSFVKNETRADPYLRSLLGARSPVSLPLTRLLTDSKTHRCVITCGDCSPTVNAATGRSLNFNEASVGLTCNRRVTHRFIAGVTAQSERSVHATYAYVIITDASLHLPVCRASRRMQIEFYPSSVSARAKEARRDKIQAACSLSRW